MKGVPGRSILASIEALPNQIREGWRAASAARFPSRYANAKAIVVSGMGGSALGGHVLQSLYEDRIRAPFEVVSGYALPGYVGPDTLVVLSSYSGTTEETLTCAREAEKRKAMCLAIAAGGELETMALENGWPLLRIGTADNPSNQPRMAIGSSAFLLIGALAKLGYLPVRTGEVETLISTLQKTDGRNAARALAERMADRFTLFMAAEHLFGASHVMNNQVNENAKHLSSFLPLPELNHHFLEALSFPAKAKHSLLAVLLQSKLYHPRNRKRVELTAKLLEQNGIDVAIVNADAKTKLAQVWQAIQFGAHVSLSLARLHKIDPEPVPNVAAFKKRMGKA